MLTAIAAEIGPEGVSSHVVAPGIDTGQRGLSRDLLAQAGSQPVRPVEFDEWVSLYDDAHDDSSW